MSFTINYLRDTRKCCLSMRVVRLLLVIQEHPTCEHIVLILEETKMDSKSELEENLRQIFKGDILVDFQGTSEKGDGYMGDIVFATVTGTEKNQQQQFHVVLKCSKKNEEFRATFPVRKLFLNEIAAYADVFPAFRQFETQKGISNHFASVPKFYGKLEGPNFELIVLENMKTSGFDVWNRRLPMPREYLRKVLAEYAQFHAVSVAMNDQEPRKFEELCGGLKDVFQDFINFVDIDKMFGTNMYEICDLLQGTLDDSVLQVWRDFRKRIPYVVRELTRHVDGLKSIIHSDCWCNNYMFRLDAQDNSVNAVTLIDWQVCRISHPLVDVSYFLLNAISKDDLGSIRELLDEYHALFTQRVKQLGTDLKYSQEECFDDFKKYSLYGLMQLNVIIKMCLSDAEEVGDVMDSIDKKTDIADTYNYKLKNQEEWKARMGYIIEYVVREGFLG